MSNLEMASIQILQNNPTEWELVYIVVYFAEDRVTEFKF